MYKSVFHCLRNVLWCKMSKYVSFFNVLTEIQLLKQIFLGNHDTVDPVPQAIYQIWHRCRVNLVKFIGRPQQDCAGQSSARWWGFITWVGLDDHKNFHIHMRGKKRTNQLINKSHLILPPKSCQNGKWTFSHAVISNTPVWLILSCPPFSAEHFPYSE